MYAQQGLYLHAESCWRKAQHLEGGKPEYAAGLSRLHASHNQPLRLMVLIFGLLLVGGLGVLAWQVTIVLPVRHRQVTEAIAQLSTSHALANTDIAFQFKDIREALLTTDKDNRSWLDDLSKRLLAEISSVGARLDAARVALDSSDKELRASTVAVAAELASTRRDAVESAVKLNEALAVLRVASQDQHTADAVVLGTLSKAIAAQAATLVGLLSKLAAAGEQSRDVLGQVTGVRTRLDQASEQLMAAIDAIRQELVELRRKVDLKASDDHNSRSGKSAQP